MPAHVFVSRECDCVRKILKPDLYHCEVIEDSFFFQFYILTAYTILVTQNKLFHTNTVT